MDNNLRQADQTKRDIMKNIYKLNKITSALLLTTTISFDNIGSPTATAGDLSINLGSTTITIEPETGFAHE